MSTSRPGVKGLGGRLSPVGCYSDFSDRTHYDVTLLGPEITLCHTSIHSLTHSPRRAPRGSYSLVKWVPCPTAFKGCYTGSRIGDRLLGNGRLVILVCARTGVSGFVRDYQGIVSPANRRDARLGSAHRPRPGSTYMLYAADCLREKLLLKLFSEALK